MVKIAWVWLKPQRAVGRLLTLKRVTTLAMSSGAPSVKYRTAVQSMPYRVYQQLYQLPYLVNRAVVVTQAQFCVKHRLKSPGVAGYDY